MKVLVCGGRDYDDDLHVFSTLCAEHRETLISLIIEGGADGADAWAQAWARAFGVQCQTVRADWQKHGRAAGPMRNAQMLTLKPDLVIAFPGGHGTANMVRQAKQAGVPVKIIEPRIRAA
ncbi:MAG: hypothetical protein CPSOU_1806 [uncultured Paraburkholderia sp.]|nr:MAG: hypothetical protein CPSOU_1806 [uncultured Paraburkholderia sp.]